MSLKEKLSQKATDLEQQRMSEEQQLRQEALAPIRQNIHKIENDRYQLDMIKGSLEKSDSSEDVGKRITDYATRLDKEVIEKRQPIETLMKDHQDVMETMSIKTPEELAEHPDFADEEEVVEYKEITERAPKEHEALAEGDEALKEKLAALGVTIDTENFSYDAAEKAIDEKMQALNEELVREKLKTPEGKEEALEMLVKDIEGDIAQMRLSSKQGGYDFSLKTNESSYSKRTISIINDEAKIDGNDYSIRFVPEKIKNIKEIYGEEIAEQAVTKAYDMQIEKAFKEFDKYNYSVEQMIPELERMRPMKAEKSRAAFLSFKSQNAAMFEETARAKRKSFTDTGLDFHDDGSFFQTISGMSNLGYYKGDDENIFKEINHSDKFPPSFDWEKLSEKIESRSQQNKHLLEVLEGIHTQDDLDAFLSWGDKAKGNEDAIGSINRGWAKESKFFGWRDDEYEGAVDPRYRLPFEKGSSQAQEVSEKLRNFRTYGEVAEFYREKEKELSSLKQKVHGVIEKAVSQEILRGKLKALIETEKIGRDIDDVERGIQQLEREKNSATEIMSQLIRIEQKLPKDKEITFSNLRFEITEDAERFRELGNLIDKENVALQEKNEEIKAKGPKPRIFGAGAWQDSVDDLNREKMVIEDTIASMKNERVDLRNKEESKLNIGNVSVEEDFKKLRLKGTAEEIFDILREKLREIKDKTISSEVINLYQQYKGSQK